MKIKIINKLIKNKNKGEGDLIASFFVILALTIFVYFFINIIADVNTRIQMDQVARKYILRMETSGYLTAEEQNNIRDELDSIPSVHQAIGSDKSLIKFSHGSYASTTTAQGYGATIVLVIECPAATTQFILPGSGGSITTEDQSNLGSIVRNNKTARNYIIMKSSTAKY